jgi:hypothetical protein
MDQMHFKMIMFMFIRMVTAKEEVNEEDFDKN